MNPKKLEIGESRLRAIVRLIVWLSVVVIYYLTILSLDSTDAGRIMPLDWLLPLFPLFLTPYLFGILRRIMNRDVFVFDGASGELCVNGTAVVRFDQITGLQLKAVNGTCEELRLSVKGDDNTSIDLPVDVPAGRMIAAAEQIAAMTNSPLSFIQN